MDSIPLYSTTATISGATVNSITAQFCWPSSLHPRKSRNVFFEKKPRKVSVLAAKDEPPKLDPLDQMELKFGRMLGEDPKLTLAKIMARKSNPDATHLEIEKTFEKKKRKSSDSKIEEVPFDVDEEKRSVSSVGGLNLVRPVTRKGVKVEADKKPSEGQDKKPTQPVANVVENSHCSVPNVLLRKPSIYDDVDSEISSRLSIRPNLSLRMGKEPQKERFSDITLLKKPEPLKMVPDLEGENGHSGGSKAEDGRETGNSNLDPALLRMPEQLETNFISDRADESSGGYANRSNDVNSITDGNLNNTNSYAEIAAKGNLNQALESRVTNSFEENESATGNPSTLVRVPQPSDLWSSGKSSDSSEPSATKLAESDPGFSLDASLLGKPKRMDTSVVTTSKISKEEVMPVNPESNGNALDLENFLSSPIKEREENDWTKAEGLVNLGGRVEVEIISSSTRGFTVSFGTLIGFLPYRNLAAKWKFLAFESWLRRRGLDPSKYKQHLGVIGSFETASVTPSSESQLDIDIDDKLYSEISPDTKLEDLLRIYDQQKSKFLSSFVGQIKVTVVLADRKSRRLIFSTKPKEKEELIEKKRNLMARLSVGDVVKCCIKKITYFGIFVEVDEVPALIHQTEVSWDATLDPASYFKIGQIMEAKVHQLDFSLERIFLSLKEITPDPLIEALEAVVGGHDSLDGKLEAAQADSEWAEVESLIKELQQGEGVQSVSKGRYFLSPGLAPTFQVYMASTFENQYKLLARSGNRAQEVIVETSLGKEEMKSIILTCTNRVQ
ncbi:uncharacterized protein [Coffea arabica]|uniref:Uncharacterized protein isoform X2 n=1 Tax=Coffea arabica TaxID=13443 RepID=A0A6P6U3R1_COFAR|nr:uncharacterized protein LOC113707222 isoform X2 [Coffea arabica]